MNNFEKIKAGDLVEDPHRRQGIVVSVRKYAECERTTEVEVYMVTLGYKIIWWADALCKVA
jgi:hypothetical protein